MDSFSSHDVAPQNENNDSPKQREILSYMDSVLYEAAAKGKIDPFNSRMEPLDFLLTPNKNTVLHIHILARSEAAQSIPFIEKILHNCPSLLLKANIRGETPLHLAARHGHEDIVKALIDSAKAQHQDLESGAGEARKMLRMTNRDKETALHEATRLNHLAVVRILAREDPDFTYLANEEGETPVYLAAERGYRDIVFEILDTLHEAYNGPNGRTALHEAVIRSDAEMVRKMLGEKDTLAKEVDQQGWTPLHHASNLGDFSILSELLKSDKSAAYIRDEEGMIPLHIAAVHGHTELVKSIISACPDSCEIVDNRGRNVIHFSVQSQEHYAMPEYLISVPSFSNLINEKDVDGNTPVHMLATFCFDSGPLIRHPGVDKKAVNKQNRTALDIVLTDVDNYAWGLKGRTTKKMKKAGYERSRRRAIKIICRPGEIDEGFFSYLQKARDAHLIVATLIATVTFAAGFTLPGGYISDKGAEQGTAILTRKAAFNAFLITDTIALAVSTCVVLIHFYLALNQNKRRLYNLMLLASTLIIIAMASMAVAFMTGTYAVLPHSSAPGTVICIIISCIFVVCYYILKHTWSIITE